MPKYKIHPKDMKVLDWNDVKNLMNATDKKALRVLLMLFWTTGARPGELLAMKKENFEIKENELILTVPTSKLGSAGSGDFFMRTRPLQIERPQGTGINWDLEAVVEYVQALQPGQALFSITKRWVEIQFNSLGMKVLNQPITPYHLRHAANCREGKNHSTTELMYFKGASSIKSVQPYMRAMAYKVKL